MENKNIILIAFAVFSIVILLAHGNIEKVYAITTVDNTVDDVLAPQFHAVSTFGGVFTVYLEGTDEVKTFRGSNGALLYTTDLTTVAESVAGTSAGTAIPRAMQCGGNTCYVLFSVTISASPKCNVVQVNVTTGGASVEYTIPAACHNVIAKSGSLLYVIRDNAGAEVLLELNTATSPFNATQLSSDLGTGSVYCLKVITLSSLSYLGICSDVATNWFKLFKLSTSTICTVAGTFIAQDVDSDGTSAYVGLSTGDTKKITSGCAVTSTITAQCGTDIQSVIIRTNTNSMYLGCDGGDSISRYNLTSGTEVVEYACGASIVASSYMKIMAFDNLHDALACATYTGDKLRIIYQGEPEEEEEEESQADNDCLTNPETVFCRLGGSTDNQTSGIGGIVGNGIVSLGCNVAFVDCTEDDNPATNGLGLLIFIASIFVVVGMFYWSIGTDSFRMPLFLWVIIILALSAFFTIIGIIDPVFLILSIVAIIALAAPKAIESLKGSTFGRGSTD